MPRLSRFLFAIVSLGVSDECDDDMRTNRRVFTGASLFVGVAGPFWGAMYIGFGELGPGLIPTIYSAITLVSFVVLWRHGGWQWFRVSQLVLIYILPIALMLSLGGYVLGSVVMIWAVLAPLGSLWGGRSREAAFWIAAFLLAAVVSGVVNPYLRDSNDLPEALRTVLFVMNVSFVTGAVFLLLDFFVRQKDTVIDVMRRNRELESAYLAQEITLRQNDKLATLGKLSAGMAHELNNPTAAAQQATKQLSSILSDPRLLDAEMSGLDLVESERHAVDSYTALIGERTLRPDFLDPLERSDREAEVQDFLEGVGVDEAWEIAPSLVNMGLAAVDLAGLADQLRADRLARAVAILAAQHRRASLLGSLDESTGRIIEIVRALKAYTYLDQAPRQLIDVHRGLDSTLVMLQNRLKTGIEVHRSYAEELPQIEAYGSELNQVWTNILDNAIDAMDARGTIEIVTRRSGDDVVVELTDTGPGVPADLVDQIFDPFVTTKAPGEGTGLGLNISHTIITQKHGGEISLSSEPGRTTFTVSLPVAAPAGSGGEVQVADRRPVATVQDKE